MQTGDSHPTQGPTTTKAIQKDVSCIGRWFDRQVVVNDGIDQLSAAVRQCGSYEWETKSGFLGRFWQPFRQSHHFRAKTHPAGRISVINYGVWLHLARTQKTSLQ
jgi:hypothetical protein